MEGEAPLPFVNPEWLTLTGSVFDDHHGPSVRALQTNLEPRYPPFTPYARAQPPFQTLDDPLRGPHFDPALAPSPTPSPSPTRTRLDPTAPLFTPKQSSSRLRVETNVQQEPVTPASTTPRTPRIQVSPADDLVVVANDAAVRVFGQLSRSRRQSSPGRRPTGIQRQGSVSGRKTTIVRPALATPMCRGASAPGPRAGTVDTIDILPSAPQSHRASQGSRSLAPVQPVSGPTNDMLPPPTPVLTSRAVSATGSYTPHAVGPRASLRPPQTPMQQPINPFLAPVQPMHPATWLAHTHNVGYEDHLRSPQALRDPTEATGPATPRSTPTRSRASSLQGRRPLVCTYQGCHHRAQGKTFKTPGDLRKHQRIHLPESQRPYGCTVHGCTRRFFWPKDVTRHVEVVHEKAKVKCEQCDAELCRADDLVRHVATVHNGHAASPRNWVAPSPSASSVASFAMTPRSEYSFAAPGTPLSSFGSASRPKMPHLASFNSIPEGDYDVPGSVPMSKSLTR